MKVLLFGSGGQLGRELQRTVPDKYRLTGLGSQACNICDCDAIRNAIVRYQPDVIINAAAYTAVDKAETEAEDSFAVNASGAANLAEIASATGARLVHISTDFIFDGQKSSPYLPEDQPNPLGVYGASKLEGEQRVSRILADKALIVRAAWVYSSFGNNFVKTMLRLMADRDSLGVVADQIGTPTWAYGLGQGIWLSVEKNLSGIYHWTDSGVASWYDFAVAIYEEALHLGILTNKLDIIPIRTEDYPTPARRPLYSVLDKTSICKALKYIQPHWRLNLRKMLHELKGLNNE